MNCNKNASFIYGDCNKNVNIATLCTYISYLTECYVCILAADAYKHTCMQIVFANEIVYDNRPCSSQCRYEKIPLEERDTEFHVMQCKTYKPIRSSFFFLNEMNNFRAPFKNSTDIEKFQSQYEYRLHGN